MSSLSSSPPPFSEHLTSDNSNSLPKSTLPSFAYHGSSSNLSSQFTPIQNPFSSVSPTTTRIDNRTPNPNPNLSPTRFSPSPQCFINNTSRSLRTLNHTPCLNLNTPPHHQNPHVVQHATFNPNRPPYPHPSCALPIPVPPPPHPPHPPLQSTPHPLWQLASPATRGPRPVPLDFALAVSLSDSLSPSSKRISWKSPTSIGGGFHGFHQSMTAVTKTKKDNFFLSIIQRRPKKIVIYHYYLPWTYHC